MSMWSLWLSFLVMTPPQLVVNGQGLILEVHGQTERSEPKVIAGNVQLEVRKPGVYLLTAQNQQGTLEVPESLEIRLEGTGNGISLQNLTGQVTVQTDFSQIRILDFRGTLTLGGRGNQVAIIRGQGVIEGTDELGDLTIQESSGIVDLTGRLSSFQIESFEGPMKVTLNGWLQVRHYQGSFELASDYLHAILEDLEGVLRATARSGSLKLYNIRGQGVVRGSRKTIVVPQDVHGVHVIYVKEGR